MALQGTLNICCTFGTPPLSRQPARRCTGRSVVVCAQQSFQIAVLPGDGIGPEITKVALKAMQSAGRKDGVAFEFTEALVGGAAIDATGVPLPDATMAQCRGSDAVLLAAIGGCTNGTSCPTDHTPRTEHDATAACLRATRLHESMPQ